MVTPLQLTPTDIDASKAPNYIEFLKMVTTQDIDLVAMRFFGPDFRGKDFIHTFGVDVKKFIGFYAEVGVAQSPIGPLYPARISPILVLKLSNRGRFSPHILKVDGFIQHGKRRAWASAQKWDEVTGDNFYEEVNKAYKNEQK